MSNPDFHLPAQVDLALLPWSLTDDIIDVKALLRFFLQKMPEMVREEGELVFDKPVPLGQNSHLGRMEQGIEKFPVWGMAEVPFMGSKEEIVSIFNFYDPRELLNILSQADFLPLNFPEDPVEQEKLLIDIQKNEGQLAARSGSGEDIDAMKHAIWDAKGKNRGTFVCRRVGKKEMEKRDWFVPSAFMRVAFPSPVAGPSISSGVPA